MNSALINPWKCSQIASKYFLMSLSILLCSDCLRRESNILALTHPVTALCVCVLLHCMRVRLCNGYTRAYAQIMQHTHTHKAVTGRAEAKKLFSRRRQSNYGEYFLMSSEYEFSFN